MQEIRRYGRALVALVFSLSIAIDAAAEEKGQGFIVLKQGTPLYARSKGDRVLGYANEGEAVAGYNMSDHALSGAGIKKVQAGGWFGEQENGRIGVMVFIEDGKRNRTIDGWMPKENLSPFSYECGCGSETQADRCSPFMYQSKGFFSAVNWNMCFEEAKTKKVAEMKAPSSTPAAAPAGTSSVEERLQKLEDLKKKGLVTEEEYKAKRAEILKDM